MDLLANAQLHLDRIGETGALAQRVLDQVEASASGGHSAPTISRQWILMHLGYSPQLRAEMASKAVDLAGTVGVPRRVSAVGIPGPCACLLLALTRASDADRVQIVHALQAPSLRESIQGNDPVGLAACIQQECFEALRVDCLNRGLPAHVIALVDSAWLIATMVHSPFELQDRDWGWTPVLHQFFAIKGYRGIRRRAARMWGRDGAGDLCGLVSQHPDEAYGNDGFAAFIVEWFLSRISSLVDKPAAKEAMHKQALECVGRLRDAMSIDAAVWLEQEIASQAQAEIISGGGSWD